MQHIVLFDGVCNLCNGAVQFIIRHDKKNIFRFASLQSEYAKKIAGNNPLLQTMYLLENGNLFSRSTAVLKIARHLRFPFNLFYGFIVVPAFIRNGIYNWVAKNRYKWFGKTDECMIPTPALKQKFLD